MIKFGTMRKRFSIILMVALLYACGIPMGDRVDVDTEDLQIYYLEGVEKTVAIKFAKYWKQNGFVGDRKQVIQISREEERYILKLIEREMYHEESLTIDERAKLQQLERTLEGEVFNGEVEIIITDNTFRPIERK